jgi:hypothetical protein
MTVCPFAVWKPVSGHGGVMASHLGLVLHVQQGNNSLAGWFNNPGAGASSTWWVSKTGVLEQYVDANVSAWAQAQGNSTYNSIESEGYTTEPLTAAAEATLARLYKWGHDVYGWPYSLAESPGVRGFGWHGMGGAAWGGHTGCPGDLRKNRRQAILTAAQGSAPAPDPKPPTPAPKPPAGVPPLHVDYFGRTHNSTVPDVRTYQQQMKNRGWAIGVDGIFGPQSEQVTVQYQREKHLTADGLVGPQTWNSVFTAPVT